MQPTELNKEDLKEAFNKLQKQEKQEVKKELSKPKTARINNDLPSSHLLTHLPASIKMAEGSGEVTKVSIRGYSGNSVDLSDYGVDAPVVYNMKGITNKARIPYLLEHSRNQVLGAVESIVNNGKELTAVAEHSYPSELSKTTGKAIENKVPYEASMGLEINVDSVTYHAKGVVEANGRVFNAPIYLVGESKLVELSACLFGRDGDTEVTKLSKETLTMIKNAKGTVTDPVVDPAVLQAELDNTKKELEAVKAELAKPTTPAPLPPEKDIETVVNNRMERVLLLMSKYKDHPELIQNAVKENWDDDRMEREVKLKSIDNSYPGVPGVYVPNNKVEGTFLARMALSAGVAPEFIEKKTSKQVVEMAMNEGEIGFKESLMMVANANGGRFNGHSDTHNLSKFIKRLTINNAFSTIDFPNLMHQIATWKMEEAWMLDPPFAPEISMKESNNSFNPEGHLKPSGGTMWTGLNQEGKITHGSFGNEDKYFNSTKTVAQIVTFKREDIENDSFGWIDQVLALMVEGAMMVPDYQLTNLIYNAKTTAANMLTASVSQFALPLTLANLETVYDAIKLRNIAKGELTVKVQNMTKYWLVVGPGLEKEAWEIIKQDRFIQGPTGEFVGANNYWKDKFDIKVFNQLGNVTYHPDATAGTWGLVPQNTKYSPFAMTLFKGRSKPVTETVDLPADELGFGVRGYWDVKMNYRPVENNKLQATAWSYVADDAS